MIKWLASCWLITLVLQFFSVDFPWLLWAFDGALSLIFLGIFTLRRGLVRFVMQRVMEAVIVVGIVATLTFFLLRILPGGPFDTDKALPPEVKANIEAKYELNAPVYRQYLKYIGGLMHGDLGESYKYVGRNVSEIIVETLPISLELGMFALVLAFLLGVPVGVYAAARHNSWVDHVLMVIAVSGVSLPSFLIAPILILIFCFGVHWFEPALWAGPTYYVLPVVVLASRATAILARLTRASVLEVIGSDCIRTARSKGLSENQILFKHVLKNSLLPILTLSGPLAAEILSGAFVVEQIFAIPGLGKHVILSVSNRDYPLILGTTLLFSSLLVFANLIVDLLYAYFDPRIQVS
jgi:oligopeptide transport system permease protein